MIATGGHTLPAHPSPKLGRNEETRILRGTRCYEQITRAPTATTSTCFAETGEKFEEEASTATTNAKAQSSPRPPRIVTARQFCGAWTSGKIPREIVPMGSCTLEKLLQFVFVLLRALVYANLSLRG